MQPHTVKCYYRDECRRFGIAWPETELYRHLIKEIQDAFRLSRENILVIRYADQDGDFVNVDRDSELNDAFACAQNGVLKVYAEDAPTDANGNSQPNGFQWKTFSEQEKLAIRKAFTAADGIIGLVKPDPRFRLTRVADENGDAGGGFMSLVRKYSPENFALTQERQGFGANASTAQVFVQVLNFGFEAYNAATSSE